MFVILLRFSAGKVLAPQHMAAHKAWLDRGYADGVFLLSGSLRPGLGGAILAQGCTHEELATRIAEDPFVAHDVVQAEILDIQAARSDTRLAFLTEAA